MEEKGCNVYEKLIILILFFSPFTSINILGLKISEILVLLMFFVSILRKDIMLKKSYIFSKFIFIYIFISVIGFCYKVLFISQQSINLNEIIFDLLAYIFIFIASITLESLILASISKVNIHTILKKTYYISTITIYECENCNGCTYKNKCTKAKGNKRLHVSKEFIKYRKKSLENITTPEGKLLRLNRSIQVEGAFGILKQDYGFRRFLLRGKKNIRTEFMLLCFAYNIKKLFNKTIKKRNGILLHQMKIA